MRTVQYMAVWEKIHQKLGFALLLAYTYFDPFEVINILGVQVKRGLVMEFLVSERIKLIKIYRRLQTQSGD